MESALQHYLGDGSRRLKSAPDYEQVMKRDPALYIAKRDLRDAVNVAILLGMPLLVTGDPGTGKTELAHSVAWEMGQSEPLVFNAKTTSTAQELFYHYDALGHFQASHLPGAEVDIRKFIEYQALGLAILLSLPPEKANPHLPEKWKNKGPVRSVVLIDEIDKAPRDLPNDILHEIDRMAFRVKETKDEFRNEGGDSSPFRPIVIMTSNSEKHLPDAFLRRCVYYHIPFPESDEDLTRILSGRLTLKRLDETHRKNALQIFRDVRKLELSRKPATAELLNWMVRLDREPEAAVHLATNNRGALAASYTLLVKNTDDLKKVYDSFGITETINEKS